MTWSTYLKSLRDERASTLWWSVSLAALAFIMTLFWPTIRDSPDMAGLVESYPPALRALFGIEDFLSPAGYLKAELFSLMVPLLLLVFAVGRGASAIAGEEDKRTMDVLLSLPQSRRRVVLEKTAALATATAILGLALFAALALGALVVDMDISPGLLAAASADAALLALAFGGLALAVGAATGRRGLAVGVAAGVGTVTYFTNGLADLVEWLKPLRPLSPFHHYLAKNPLTDGLGVGALVLLALAAVLFALAAWGFDRRDVRG